MPQSKVKKSAGILLFRRKEQIEFFLVHPGGPFWRNKDEGAWSVPKGEFDDESPLHAALREFREETGAVLNNAEFDLGTLKTRGGKLLFCFAAEGDLDADQIKSNFFELEWPPRSGKMIQVPEVDKGAWFSYEEACNRINASQKPFLDRLLNCLH